MSSKTKTILVRTLWNIFYFRLKLWCGLCASLAILAFVGCDQDHKKYELASKEQSIRYNRVSPDTIYFSELPDSVRPKPILLKSRPEPLKVVLPKTFSLSRPNFHPLFPETQLTPPVEVKAEFSTMFRNYSTEEGVAVDVTSCSFADSKGNLWFGTFVGGLNKYNGKVFTRYTKAHGLISNEITGITEDQHGHIWIATSEGVSKFDGAGFTTVYQESVVYNILPDSDGTLWFATETGLVHHTSKGNTLYSKNDGLSGDYAYDLVQNEQGDLFIGTENGISRFDGQKFTDLVNEIDPVYKPVRKMILDRDQSIWLASPLGLAKLSDGKLSYYSTDKKFNPNADTAMYMDSQNNIWLVVRGEGVLQFDGSNFRSINSSKGIRNNEIANIVEDANGNIWFGTDAGISKYSGDAIINFTLEQGIIDKSIRSIVQDDEGCLWFAGNSDGLSRFDGVHFLNFGRAQGLPTSMFWAMETDHKGNIWLGTYGDDPGDGLLKFDGTSFITFSKHQGLPSNKVYFIHNDPNGDLYIATAEGISIFDGRSFRNYSDRNGLVNNQVYCITKAKNGDFWFGTGNGISRYNGRSFINYYGENGPGSADIKSILEDKEGNLWIGSYGKGLYRFDGNSFHQFTIEDGLPDEVVTQVALSEEGDIIVGTNNGIAILKGFDHKRKINDFDNNLDRLHIEIEVHNTLTNNELAEYIPVFEVFNTSTGYQIKDVNRGQHGIYLDKKGILWIATGSEKSGLVRMDYNGLSKNKRPPHSVLTAIKINNENISWRSLIVDKVDEKPAIASNYVVDASISEEVTTYGKILSSEEKLDLRYKYKDVAFDSVSPFHAIPQNLILPHAHNNLTLEFCAIEPADPKLIKYQFKLEGYSESWSPLSNQTVATFGNIFEGDYIFHLRAQSPRGVWSSTLR